MSNIFHAKTIIDIRWFQSENHHAPCYTHTQTLEVIK